MGMNVFNIIDLKTSHLLHTIKDFCLCFVECVVSRKSKMIFIFGSPYHPNMGDQAQTYCIQLWLEKNYPEYGILIHRMSSMSRMRYLFLKHTVRKDDILVFHSGYHFTNLYHEQEVYFKILSMFPNKRVIVFPQTINYTTQEALKQAKEVLNNHRNLTILCRDEKSFAMAREHFTSPKLLLYPDIVTSLIGTKSFNNKRDGVLFCMRDDIEAFYKPEQIEDLKKRFVNIMVNQTDTTLNQYKNDMRYLYNHREEILNEIWEEYSTYKVIITDRYHGTIFSLIAGTPVVVIGSTDHKLSSGVKWFPKEVFGDYITFANDLDEAYEKAFNILNNYDKYTHCLPPYFKVEYYDKLNTFLI